MSGTLETRFEVTGSSRLGVRKDCIRVESITSDQAMSLY